MISFQNILSGELIVAGISTSAATCSLCGSNPIPDDGLLHQRHGIKCIDLFNQLTYMEGGTEECNIIQLTAYQTGCCNEQYVPVDVCSVCPDGSPYSTDISVPGASNRRELTCAELPSEASFLNYFTTPGDCSDTFLQRSAAWCECPGHKVECHLCPGGASPPDLSKTEQVLYGWDCSSFQFVTALLSEVECSLASEILEFDAAAFCCEGLDPPDLCPFCPTGQKVADPDKVVPTQYGFLKCGDIEESLRMVPTTESCSLVMQSFDSSLCCEYPGSGALAVTKRISYFSIAAAFLSTLFFIVL